MNSAICSPSDNNSDSGDRARWVYVVEGGEIQGWRMPYQYLNDRGLRSIASGCGIRRSQGNDGLHRAAGGLDRRWAIGRRLLSRHRLGRQMARPFLSVRFSRRSGPQRRAIPGGEAQRSVVRNGRRARSSSVHPADRRSIAGRQTRPCTSPIGSKGGAAPAEGGSTNCSIPPRNTTRPCWK